jgi:outer membrane biosynthesis protein TonB
MIMTKALLILIGLNLLMIQCGSHSRPDSSKAKNDRSAGETKCDFSEFKPLKAKANYGSPMVSMPKPAYPPEAKERGVKGPVSVVMLVNVHSGQVEKTCVKSGDEMLRAAATDAAMKVQFQPYSKYIQDHYSYAEEIITYTFSPPP